MKEPSVDHACVGEVAPHFFWQRISSALLLDGVGKSLGQGGVGVDETRELVATDLVGGKTGLLELQGDGLDLLGWW